jgi:hypothetical protein
MKFNKWTLGLAAVGAVSMASAVRADEAKLSALQTALSNTTISGYVDVGANWTAGDQPTLDQYNSVKKTDRFSLNDVVISLDKPLDESPWAAGYHIDLNWGEDAIGVSGLSDSYWDYTKNAYNYGNIRQAYVALRTPLGNGIDWKFGVMDGITGYEGNTSYLNPNISRSFGYGVNPASYVGMLGTYKIVDAVSVTAGVINPTYYTINVSSKSYVGAIAFTAPESLGFLKGSVLNLQTIQSFEANSTSNGINNYSANATFNTPLAGLKFGLSYDYVQILGAHANYGDGAIYGVYATYQATDKLSLALRGEYLDSRWETPLIGGVVGIDQDAGQGTEVTATVQYDLWANVVSRVELRWDHTDHYGEYGAHGDNNYDLLAINLSLVYKF